MEPIDEKVQRSFDRDAVRDAILLLAHEMTNGRNDPEDDEEVIAQVTALADVLSNVTFRAAAEGIQMAITLMWATWITGNSDLTGLRDGYDAIDDQDQRPEN